MALVKGPFELTWNSNTLTDIEEVNVDYNVDTEDFQTVQGKTYELAGAHKVSVELTVLGNDAASLAALLPQYAVAAGNPISTGETADEGAIDIVPGDCTTAEVLDDLEIVSCGNPGQTLRVVDAKSEIAGIEVSDKIRKVVVRFTGQSADDVATVQFFEEGSLTPAS